MAGQFFIKGIGVGVAIAAPVGPVALLCIQRTLKEGRLAGFVSGLGAATADTFYGWLAGFGLTFVGRFMVEHQAWIHVLGGLFLCFMGFRTFNAAPAAAEESLKGSGLLRAYISTLLVTLTNPATILAFAGIFAGVGLTRSGTTYSAVGVLVAGVFLGSALWWFFLSYGVSVVRHGIDKSLMKWINRVAGIMIIVFGVVALLTYRTTAGMNMLR